MLARGVANAIGATYLRIDRIESAIVSTLMPYRDNPVGYVVAERVAADQLVAGRDVVADAVNGVAAARAGWVALAARTHAELRFVEVRCSDAAENDKGTPLLNRAQGRLRDLARQCRRRAAAAG
jgi:predicted kinase